MNSFKEKYNKEIIPKMMEKFQYRNINMAPKIEKIVLNVGLSKGLKDTKYMEIIEDTLRRITGQKPVFTKAKKSISSFKIREGMIVGVKVTLRGAKMYDFLNKLINVTFPRVRDFRGVLTKGMDGHGNYSIGFREHIAFPEINPDEVEYMHGLEIIINTTAQTNKEGLELLRLAGFPFIK